MKSKIMIFLLSLTLGASALSSMALAGTITGTVNYEGEVPRFKPIKMEADPMCLTHHSGEVMPQSLILGEGQTMANVFVHIVSGVAKKAYPPPAQTAVIDQKGCMYDPHVLGVMVGQTVKILNPDGTLHNVHALSKVNPEFNLAMPKFRTEVEKKFEKPEFMFLLKCDVHPWMGAWISVMDHPYFNVTKPDGKFIINDLPAGNYEIEAWHEKLGVQKQTVTLADGESKELNFTFVKPSN
jgi:plastocyanin